MEERVEPSCEIFIRISRSSVLRQTERFLPFIEWPSNAETQMLRFPDLVILPLCRGRPVQCLLPWPLASFQKGCRQEASRNVGTRRLLDWSHTVRWYYQIRESLHLINLICSSLSRGPNQKRGAELPWPIRGPGWSECRRTDCSAVGHLNFCSSHRNEPLANCLPALSVRVMQGNHRRFCAKRVA